MMGIRYKPLYFILVYITSFLLRECWFFYCLLIPLKTDYDFSCKLNCICLIDIIFPPLFVGPFWLFMLADLNQKFKPKLQIYAQRKNIGLPTYHSTSVGPPNSLCFRTTVTVGGDSFNSPGGYKTIKQAEDAAAQVALMAFSTEAFQEVNCHEI